MLARELARPFPTVTLDTDALEAARILAEQRLPGLIVLDDGGLPHTVLPGSQVLRFVVPKYVQDDPALARAFDERSADALADKLAGRTVRDMLPEKQDRLSVPVVDPRSTAIEIAAGMAGLRSPLVAVVDGHELLGAITVSALLDHLVGPGTSR
jgi:CBS domain-containing protein